MGDSKDDPKAKDTAETLFQTAMIESGYEISDPADLAQRVYKLMSMQLGVDPNEAVKEIELPEEEEEADTTEETEEEGEAEAEEDSEEEKTEEKKDEEL